MLFLHSSMERALTYVSDIGLIPIVGPTSCSNQVCSLFLIVYNVLVLNPSNGSQYNGYLNININDNKSQNNII